MGSLLALSAHRQLSAAGSVLRNRWFTEAALFGLLIFMPVGVAFYPQWPDWSWLYYFDSRTFGRAAVVGVWISYPLAVCLGFLGSAWLLRGARPLLGWAVPGVMFAILAAVSGLSLMRFITRTDFDGFGRFVGETTPDFPYIWTDSNWLLTMGASGVVVGAPFLFLAVRNIREGGGDFYLRREIK